MLKIGIVPYLNALPLYRYLPYPVVYGTPFELNQKMIENELDVALLPSFAFLERPDWIPLFEEGVIQSHGAVESVALFYRSEKEGPQSIRSINYSEESITSIALFKVIYSKFWKQDLGRLNVDQKTKEAFLAIGDKALFYNDPAYKKLDLGEEWTRLTGLSFVYALWVARSPLSPEERTIFLNAKKEGLANIEEIIQGLNDYPQERVRPYLTKRISYEITLSGLEGLKKFQDYCFESGLLTEKRKLLE